MKKVIKILFCVVLSAATLLCVFSCKKNPDLTTDGDYDLLQNVIRFVQENYYKEMDKDTADLYAAYGIIESLGEHNYIYPDRPSASTGDTSGFGLLVKSTFYNEVFIDWILPGSPFENESNGVKPQRGDEIYAIDGKRISGADKSYFQSLVAAKKKGVDTVFTLKRNGESLNVTYQKIDYDFPQCYYVNDLPGIPSDFGYICLRSFDGSYTRILAEITESFKSYLEDGNKALILDLRGNGGGSTSVLTRMASYLIGDVKDEKYYNAKTKNYNVPLVEVNYVRAGKTHVYSTTPSQYAIKDPIYVLADGGTASASEALIGAMKAHGTLTKLIGKETVGKGVAQNGFTYYSDRDPGYLYDYFKNEDGETVREGFFVQVVVGEYYIIDDSKEGGKYCMNGVPFKPDVEIDGTNPITTSFADDLYIAAAIADYQANQ